MKPLQFLFILIFSFNSMYSFAAHTELIIVSDKNHQAIEGAVIYDQNTHTAYRSDKKGKVWLADGINNIQVKAKYHSPRKVTIATLTQKSTDKLAKNTIIMAHDKKLLVDDQALTHPRSHQLWGDYGQYRANNDLLSYDLSIKVMPETQSIAGNNKIRFKMLKTDNTIQIDLYHNLKIEKILQNNQNARLIVVYRNNKNLFLVRCLF